MSARPVLEVRALDVRRGETIILRDVSWQVRKGEHWVILGANGSGKTSLLKALTGYLSPTDGGISVLGRTYGQSDWRELRKKIGMVSSSIRQMLADDEPALETVISGKYAMIDFWGRASASDRKQARRILEQIECAHLAERRWEVLSQGERQRILIGRALMSRPQLLILDEPCAGLDPAAREQFLEFVQRLGGASGGSERRAEPSFTHTLSRAVGIHPTLVLVTHHIEEIMPVFSHVLVLKAGQVIAAGPRASVLKNRVLSDAFNTVMRIHKAGDRLSVRPTVRRDFVI